MKGREFSRLGALLVFVLATLFVDLHFIQISENEQEAPSDQPGYQVSPNKGLVAGEEQLVDAINERTANIPRTIFMYWDRGWENAQGAAQLAIRSWMYHIGNIDIEIEHAPFTIRNMNDTEAEALTNRTSYVPDHIWGNLTVQARSDIYRTILLHKYGGIWVDASVVANMPIDASWLDLDAEDLVSFERDGNEGQKRKLNITHWITSWFLAAPPKSYTLARVLDVIQDPHEWYRFTNKDYFWWHRIVSELASSDTLIRDNIATFAKAGAGHCMGAHFEQVAPVLKRCANEKMPAILVISQQCCKHKAATPESTSASTLAIMSPIYKPPPAENTTKKVDASSICPLWNCVVLGENYRHWPAIKDIFEDDEMPQIESKHFNPAWQQ